MLGKQIMGDEVNKHHFTHKDYRLFQKKLDQEMEFVRDLFKHKKFDHKTRKLGYEVELCLLDSSGLPAPLNEEILIEADNKLLTYELARYNLEINGHAFAVHDQVFNEIQQDLTELYSQVEDAASKFDAQVGLFGVLPSLQRRHLERDKYMSAMYRYKLLDKRLMDMRDRPIHLEIHGEDHLQIEHNDVMLEAMGTSLQMHYQIPFDEAVDSYHAALWSSMALLAASANSPLVLQKNCWRESRIAIFKQAVDTRNSQEMHDAIIPRVHLAKGYIKSWLELFEDNHYYSPVLPEVIDCGVEQLHHFNLHNGTIWRWVRPILGVDGDGLYHLRLELRVTPSGPTLIDTLANMVFYIGLTEGLKQASGELTRIPFEVLEQDFYSVARHGLDARVSWLRGEMDSMQNLLLKHAIPVAYQGLDQLGISSPEQWLGIIEQRVKTGQTGANWILKYWQKSHNTAELVKTYLQHAKRNIPVHSWPKP